MNKIILGKYVNTHGIKGEIRIKSNFKYKDRVFKIGNEIIIDKPYKIMSYRVHKDFDMVTLEGINSINDIISLKNSLVYIDKDKYMNESDYLDSDLIGYNIISNNKNYGKLTNIYNINDKKKMLEISEKLVPFEFIENIDHNKKEIIIKYVEGIL